MLAPLHDARQAYLRLDAVAISAKMTAEGLAHMFVAAELLARVDGISTTLASRILGVEISTSVTASGSRR